MGELYPRWLYAMNDGFGSPAFFYYAPLPYYFTTFLTWLFHLQSAAPYPVILCASIVLWLSGVTGYYWVARFTTRSAALLLGILYMIVITSYSIHYTKLYDDLFPEVIESFWYRHINGLIRFFQSPPKYYLNYLNKLHL